MVSTNIQRWGGLGITRPNIQNVGKQGGQRPTSKKRKGRPPNGIEVDCSKKIDLTIEEAVDDMKLTPWRSMQGIKDEQLLVSVAKELSLEEMVTEFNK